MISPRSPQTEAKYQEFKKAKQSAGVDLCRFDLSEETIIREFEHWLIIENRFPYDNMTSVNHMLIPKRRFSETEEMTVPESDEYLKIKKILTQEAYYDALVENFPRSKSVSKHLHLHLVRWKYTTEDGGNLSEQIL